jgi:hypothetical protein
MLDGEDEMITIAAQIEIAISPGVEFDEDGDAMAPLQLAQIGE